MMSEHIDPMSASNVKKHAALLEAEKMPRRTAHEDCCGYCDRYCQGKITTSKRNDIEAWRQNVQVHNAKQQHPKLVFLRCNSQMKNTQPPSKCSETPRLLNRGWAETSWKKGMEETESPASQGSFSRTCSNELLNVLTIDDATRIQRHEILEQWKQSRSSSRRNCPVMSLRQSSSSTLHLRSTASLVEKAEPLSTVVRAIDNSVRTRNQAHRGLSTHKRPCTEPVKESQESGRFMRMNFQLRRMVERQVLNNSPLSRKMQRGSSFSNHSEGQMRSGQLPSSVDGRLTTSRVIAPEKENFLELLMDLDKTTDAVR